MPTRLLAAAFLALVAGCAPTPEIRMGTDGKPLPRFYDLAGETPATVQFRMLDAVNTLRDASGAPALAYDPRLNAAAATHSRDMRVQNRPWHFGSDGSSPLDRARRAGYRGELLGETISESFETELETLAAWMEAAETRGVILDPRARDMGFAWTQEPSGKIWWTLVTGTPAAPPGGGTGRNHARDGRWGLRRVDGQT